MDFYNYLLIYRHDILYYLSYLPYFLCIYICFILLRQFIFIRNPCILYKLT